MNKLIYYLLETLSSPTLKQRNYFSFN